MRRIFYSEILDKWLNIVVTLRTCDLVDEAIVYSVHILANTIMRKLRKKKIFL